MRSLQFQTQKRVLWGDEPQQLASFGKHTLVVLPGAHAGCISTSDLGMLPTAATVVFFEERKGCRRCRRYTCRVRLHRPTGPTVITIATS